jgi:phosphoglycolate phosphatase
MALLKGLIFDLDGTLVDSAPDLSQALNATLHEAGRPPLDLDTVKAMTGDGMMPLVTRAFERTGGLPEGFNAYNSVQTFITFYRNLKADQSQIYPDVREVLEFYRSSGVKLGICTNKHEASTHKLLHDIDLAHYFTFVAGGDTFPNHKPHPDHVLGVMEKLGATPETCVMIGDGPNDVVASHRAEMPCVVVKHGYSTDWEHLGADRLISGFSELKAAVTTLGLSLG